MTPAEFDFLRQFLKIRSGLVLSNEKQYLVESRLLPVARKAGLASIALLIGKLRDPREQKLADEVVEAMTTNESFFFRDKTPFDHLKDVMLPAMLEKRATQRKIRIWCAAASTGQEPYSIAMCLKEMGARLSGWRIEIIGTDISNDVLDRAKAGTYSQFEVQRGLPIQMLLKYFTQRGDTWEISSSLKQMVQWRKLNLLDNFSTLGTFDIVFCRNVLIYFDQPTKVDVLNRISKMVTPDGYLVLGAAETVVGLTDAFQSLPDRRGLYMPAGKAGDKRAPLAGTPRLAAFGGSAA
ncbi:Chemotaxis protein methyltransferase [Hartmannibacter diazotrophicus]|uniref:Chemotaxis protein methyltransferase n=1 Tax=Hartmannibacter diazotrophicus TaxID=1482074 RepID=A0A2C9D9Y8_9HYPH|nr:protein-glutamate O-methyltransferase CheR [Hartmannibacter diazotrophicus]SON57086.1 Chemotaxis protein methyltransferase [Hartmannibacter diazotrophicus]